MTPVAHALLPARVRPSSIAARSEAVVSAATPVLAGIAISLAVLLIAATSVAHARDIGVHPYLPTPPSPPTPGVITPQATPAPDAYYCYNSIDAIAATPAGYIIGNCDQGTRMYRSWYSDSVFEDNAWHVYQGGYILGVFQGCGWVRDDRMGYSNARSRTNCVNSADFHNDASEYAYYANCAPGVCADGSPATINANGCWINRNVRPWIPRWGENGPMRPLTPGQTLLWRYVTADDQYVMVREPGYNATNGGWGFVYKPCFGDTAQFSNPADVPGGQNPYHVYWWRSSPR